MSRKKNAALRREYQADNQRHQVGNTFYQRHENIIDIRENVSKNNRRVELIPRSRNQESYILALLDDNTDIVVVTGPAGTGKTYLAMLAAVQALRSGSVDRIILSRPAVAVDDERHGFLPGDITAKMEPWTRPLLDVLREYYTQRDIISMLNDGVVEIAPLAFCRGRNFKRCWVILDEAQNATPSQMKMIMTRIGAGSKIVITGDIEQTDRRTADNGLQDLETKLKSTTVQGIRLCEFALCDVVRHRLIPEILQLYR